jgi:diguanylate cyclase (GGDEF)-like protein
VSPTPSLLLAAAAALGCVVTLGLVLVPVLARARRRGFQAAVSRLDAELAPLAGVVRRAADRAGEVSAANEGLAPDLERLLERIAADGAPAHAFRRIGAELTARERDGYDAELEREIARAGRTSRPLALVLLDLGGLSDERARLGHAEVDRLLRDFAALLVRSARVTDTVCRRRGGQFGILLPDTDATGARHFRRRVRAAVAEADFGRLGPVTFAAGIVEWRPDESREVFDARARIAVSGTG